MNRAHSLFWFEISSWNHRLFGDICPLPAYVRHKSLFTTGRTYGVHSRVLHISPDSGHHFTKSWSKHTDTQHEAHSLWSQAQVLNIHNTQHAKQSVLGKTVILSLWSCSPACFLHLKGLPFLGGCLIFGLSIFLSPGLWLPTKMLAPRSPFPLKYSPSAEIKQSTLALFFPSPN